MRRKQEIMRWPCSTYSNSSSHLTRIAGIIS